MFKKENRLSSWLFKPLLKSKTEFSSFFRVKYKNNNDNLRISVVIPKKIIKKRVQRNLAKRKILDFLKNNVDVDVNRDVAIWLTKNILIHNNDWKKEILFIVNKIDIKK